MDFVYEEKAPAAPLDGFVVTWNEILCVVQHYPAATGGVRICMRRRWWTCRRPTVGRLSWRTTHVHFPCAASLCVVCRFSVLRGASQASRCVTTHDAHSCARRLPWIFFFEGFRCFCCFAIDATSHGNSQGKTAGDALNLDPVGCLWLMAAQ
jgi:hypothetical protein